jgi:ATP synthase protein I
VTEGAPSSGDQDDLDRAVRLRRERRERRDGERSFAENLALAGVLGWTIVLPGLAGVLIGRWLDRWLATGIMFTSALVFVGIAAGCVLAWRRIRT